MANLPSDPDGDGLYEDINGNGRKDFGDVIEFFGNITWIPVHQPIPYFDFNGNGISDFNDVIRLFLEIGI
jgi:PKD repeat protein